MQTPVPPPAWPGLAPLAVAGGGTERSQDTPSQSHTARATSGTTERPSHTQPPCQTQDPPELPANVAVLQNPRHSRFRMC